MLFNLVFRSRFPRCLLRVSRRRLCVTRRYQQDEAISLKVGGNGSVDLKIFRATAATPNNNVLIHFLPGPQPRGSVQRSTTIDSQTLANQFPAATVIELCYRLAPRNLQANYDHRFPTPIHDVFVAWDYILERIGSNESTCGAKEINHERPKICLYGSNIGGALALTLALTNPDQIHAVAIEDPLVDWVSLDEIASHVPMKRKINTRRNEEREAQAEAARVLVNLRSSLFRSPSGYFDPFASPTLFLRAPGRDTPLTQTAALVEPEDAYLDGAPIRYGDEEDEVGMVEYGRDDFGPYDDDWHTVETTKIRESFYRTSSDGESTSTTLDYSDGPGKERAELSSTPTSASPRRYKVLKRWPPNSQPEDTILPFINIYLNAPPAPVEMDRDVSSNTNTSPVIRLQGLELLQLLRRACFWGREKGLAEERVNLVELESLAASEQAANVLIQWLRTRYEDI
ncbi:hypothetical protein LTS08_007385 [Lithohypha guttulata]|nr:hypothetical protein LTS08_007385 [Lithohypha guttulata]